MPTKKTNTPVNVADTRSALDAAAKAFLDAARAHSLATQTQYAHDRGTIGGIALRALARQQDVTDLRLGVHRQTYARPDGQPVTRKHLVGGNEHPIPKGAAYTALEWRMANVEGVQSRAVEGRYVAEGPAHLVAEAAKAVEAAAEEMWYEDMKTLAVLDALSDLDAKVDPSALPVAWPALYAVEKTLKAA
ncbi:MAG: hypothetical protein AAGF99_01030 [Bacteroidota bacterium]